MIIKREKNISQAFGVDSLGFLTAIYFAVLTYNDNHISVQNVETSTSKSIVDFKEHFGGIVPHINTLVSLKELGEEDIKVMESLEIEETESHDHPFNLL